MQFSKSTYAILERVFRRAVADQVIASLLFECVPQASADVVRIGCKRTAASTCTRFVVILTTSSASAFS
jgi:hypothetical protein